MIIFDFSNIFFINMHASFEGENKKLPLNEKLVRHLVLNMIRAVNVKFRPQYGEIVIACDAKNLWRKAEFPYYKSHRKGDREKLTHIDWNAVFKLFDSLKQELMEYTSYVVIEVDGAEGDDIIATLATRFTGQKNILISADRDFKQLQAYTSVKQYDSKENRMITVDEPYKYLQEHIIKGDRGDGIPNILSDDDTFIVEGKRQKKMTAKLFEGFMSQELSKWENERARIKWHRNKKLIDLREAPEDIQDEILEQFYEQKKSNRKDRFFDYFMKYRLSNLLDCINDFKPAQGAQLSTSIPFVES